MTASSISVVVPNYNYGPYVVGCVERILAQSLRDLEVLVIDDGSTDDSWSRLQIFATEPRVQLIRHTKNVGHHGTYDEGIRRATGRFVSIVSADDLPLVGDALDVQADALEADARLGVAFGDRARIDERGEIIGVDRLRLPTFLAPTDAFRRLISGNPIMHSGALVRRACYDELGGFDQRFFVGEDWDFWLRLATRYAFAHIPRVLYAYRVHPSSLHERAGAEREHETLHAIVDAAVDRLADPTGSRALRARGHADLRLVRARYYSSQGRIGDALADMVAAVRADGSALLRLPLTHMLAHALLSILLRGRKPRVLTALRKLLGS